MQQLARWTTMKDLTNDIIGAAVEVHRYLGPGLLESTYQECLCQELLLRDIPYQRQVPLRLHYKGVDIEDKHRVDLLVAERVILELKTVEGLLPVHDAQLLSYLRLGRWPIGLLINFHVPVLAEGIRRKVWQYKE